MHLEGQIVNVWADQAADASTITKTVTGGAITLSTAASNVLVGIPYTSTLVPETLVRDLQDGTSQGKKMRIGKMNVKAINSLGGEYSTDGVTWYPMVTRTTADAMDSSPAPINGYERMSLAGNWRDVADIYLRSSQPMPFTVAAIVPSWEANESGQ